MNSRNENAARKRQQTQAIVLAVVSILASLAFSCGVLAQSGDTDPPVIRVLVGGVEMGEGQLYPQAIQPVVDVQDVSAVTVDATLDGQSFTSGDTVSGEGGHSLSVTATDAAGNVATLLRSFTLDLSPPSFAGLSPADGSIQAEAEVTLTGTATGASSMAIDGVSISLSGESFSAGPYLLAEGERSFALTATDAAGHQVAQTHQIVRDSAAPAVAMSQPAAGAVLGTPSVTVVGTATDPHLSAVTVNGIAAPLSAGSFVAAQVPLAEGANDLMAVAEDAAGNQAQVARTVTLDTTPPTLTITDPAPGTVVPEGTITVHGTASDLHLSRVEVGGVTAQIAVGAWSAQVSLTEGLNTLTATALDQVGLTATATVQVERDSTAPEISITAPVDGATLNVQTVRVEGTVEAEPGLAVTVNGLAATITGSTFAVDDIPLAEGENRLIARVMDSLGNAGSRSRFVERDTVAPAFVSSEPASGALAVPPGSRFSILFTEELAAPAAGAWRLETASGTSIPAQATVRGERLEIDPDADLPSATPLVLVLTDGLMDAGANALSNPQILTFVTADVAAPGAPSLGVTPPPRLCASAVTISGSSEPQARIEARGGAALAQTRAAQDGTFLLSVDLMPETLNRLSIRSTDIAGNVSAPTYAELVHDCTPPAVAQASRSGDNFLVTFDEAVEPGSLDQVGGLEVVDGDGYLPATITLSADGRTATYASSRAVSGTAQLTAGVAIVDLTGNALAYPFAKNFGSGTASSFVAGRVIDAATGRPLEGAQAVVIATGGVAYPDPAPGQTTGDDGRFQIPVDPGLHDLMMVRPGYAPAFRIASTTSGQGTEVFDPQLTPLAEPAGIDGAGGSAGAAPGPALTVPAGGLAAAIEVSATALGEQALPARLPYGWSPRGAAWVDLAGATLSQNATLRLPVSSPEGTTLTVVELDLQTLQWRVLAEEPVVDGAVAVLVAAEGAYAAVEADSGPLAPPAAVVGTVLGASPTPAGTEVTSAALTFDPDQVLPHQTSRATVAYTLSTDAPSGLPLSLWIQEELQLLDGSVRREAPFEADLLLFHDGTGQAQSVFDLQPSSAARRLPIQLGAEEVTVRLYAGGGVAGNVVGTAGGTVTNPDGDRVDLPPGAVSGPTPVVLERLAEGDLPISLPAEVEFAGLLRLSLSGEMLAAPAALSLALSRAPATGETGLLLEVVDLGAGPRWRVAAQLVATATGWSTAAIDDQDLSWPGVRRGGLYAFARAVADLGFVRGAVLGIGGGGLGEAGVSADSVAWLQVTNADGTYALPLMLGPSTVLAENLSSGDQAAGAVTISTADERVDLDLQILPTGPAVVAFQPGDGATGVPPGIEPTIRFTEPLQLASLSAGIRLEQEGETVPVVLEHSGTLVTVRPRATLLPGTTYTLRVTSLLRDLHGNPVTQPSTATFTTAQAGLAEGIDPERIHLVEPNGASLAQILGLSGAVPAGALVFAENTTALASTPSATAASDGSFSLSIEASLTDVLLLHVLPTGGNETVLRLGPFLTADRRGGRVGAEGGSFVTVDGIRVQVEADTFEAETVVTVTPTATDPPPAFRHESFTAVTAFDLDFGGAEAALPLRIDLPQPAGSNEGDAYLLVRLVEALGRRGFAVQDWLQVEDGVLTNGRGTASAAAAQPTLGTSTAAGTSDLAAGRTPAPSPDSSASPPLAATATGSTASARSTGPEAERGAPSLAERRAHFKTALADGDLPELHRLATQDPRNFTPGPAFPGRYQVWEPDSNIGYLAVPLGGSARASYYETTLQTVSIVNAAIARLLPFDAFLLPVFLGQPARLVVEDLDTGYQVFDGLFDPPPTPGQVAVLPRDPYDDTTPPHPVGGSPLRFFVLEALPGIEIGLAEGIRYSLEAGEIGVEGEVGAVAPGADVRLLDLDSGQLAQVQAAADGSFSLGMSAAEGGRHLLGLGARVRSDESLILRFSEALAEGYPGVELRQVTSGVASALHPQLLPGDDLASLRIEPVGGWQVGVSYRLRLGPALQDRGLNRWGRTFELDFEVESSDLLDTYEGLPNVRDVARLGSLLFVAADTDGLAVLDASNPANLTNYLPGTTTFPFPQDDPVHGVDIDPHGRVLVSGGGVGIFGQLKIVDPLLIDPQAIAAAPNDPAVLYASFRGSAQISDQVSSNVPGSQLAEGFPRRVRVLSDDQRDAWVAGQAAPGGLTISPAAPPLGGGEYALTVSGAAGAMAGKQPVTLRNLSRGRWARVDSQADGSFSLTLQVVAGDRLELLRNRQSIAYVAVLGAGVTAVDVNAFYDEGVTTPSVLGVYDQDPQLTLCNEPVAGLGSFLTDLDLLVDPANDFPVVVAGLAVKRGFVLLQADPANAGSMTLLSEQCAAVDGSRFVTGLDTVAGFAMDRDGDGDLGDEEPRDYVLLAHQVAGVLIYDATDRRNPILVSRIPVPGTAAHLTADPQARRIYVAGKAGGVYIVDLGGRSFNGLLDTNQDGRDDRVLETLALAGNSNNPLLLVPELGLGLATGLDRGLSSLALGPPRMSAISLPDAQGQSRPIGRLAPFGVPSAPEGAGGPDQVGAFQVLAALPGALGDELTVDLTAVGPGGTPLRPIPGGASVRLPEPRLSGEDGLTLRRLASNPWEDGHHLYASDPVAVLADLRATADYPRTPKEDEHCPRCDLASLGVPDDAAEILSGDEIRVSLDPENAALSATYGESRLAAATLTLPSVRWESSPSVRQEPAQNPSLGSGEVVPGTLLHSGELTQRATDLALPGRGLDFAFTRTYRNQSVGSGPLGRGWDHAYRMRLRELPTGDVELYDGTGRREVFTVDAARRGYVSPVGRFSTLERVADGWLLIDPQFQRLRFDDHGRLRAIQDANRLDETTGNEIRLVYGAGWELAGIEDSLGRQIELRYDGEGLLTELEDSTGRVVRYAYDGAGRLTSVTSPAITQGESTFPQGLTTAYAYPSSFGGLTAWLRDADDLASITDPKGQTWLQVSYGDADGDGSADEVTSQQWGAGTLSLAYDLGAGETTVTDRRGAVHQTAHNAAGQAISLLDPAGSLWQWAYTDDGLRASETLPLGRVTTIEYGGGCAGPASDPPRRSQANLSRMTITADARGANGSSSELVTCSDYEERVNRPTRTVDARGTITEIDRDSAGRPIAIREAVGTDEERLVQAEYNPFGQVVRWINPNGHVTALTYGTSGDDLGLLVTETVDPQGLALTTRREHDARGNVTAVVDPRGVRHEQSFNELGWRISTVEAASPSTDGAIALGYRTDSLYDANGNLVELRRPDLGASYVATTYSYGVLDEVLEVRRGVTTLDESVESFTYDPNLNVIEHLGPDGQRSLFTFDGRNLLAARTDGAGTAAAVTTQRSYDAEGQVTALQDGLGRSWTLGYDGYGRPQEQRDPLAQGERSEYDDGGLLLKRQRLAGSDVLAETRMAYDPLGRATVETALLWEGATPQSPTALERRFEYDPASNRTALVDRLGRRTTAHYDAAERLVRTVDAAGNEIERSLDRAGNTIETTTREITPAGGMEVVVERQSFDALGRLASQSDALGNATAYAYGPRGHLRSTTDPAGFVTFRDYDALDRLREILQPEGVRQVFGYDASSRKVTYSDGLGQETRWTYDALDRVTGVTYPDQQSVSYTYDLNHNLTQITDQNGTVLAQTYDLANRLTGRTATLAAGLAGPTTETFAWDGLSRLVSATSGAASTALTYDSLSRLIREESGGHAVAYRYDAAGNPQEMTYPSGRKVQRAFDALDRLSGVERPTGDPAAPVEALAAYAYRGPYLLAEMDLGNGIEATWEFDELRRPTRSRMRSPSGHAVFDEVMHWSPRSLKAATDRLDLGGSGKQRAYDGAGRLREEAILGKATQASPNNQRRTPAELQGKETGESFVYDPAQSLLSRKEKASGIETPQALPLDGSGRNRPAEVNGKPLEWDANGNLVRKGDQRFVYDFRNRLTRVTDLDGAEVAIYEYDALNRRLAKTVSGTRIETAWGGWSELETYQDGLLTRRHALGRSLDDRVLIEVDQTGDGQPDQVYVPVYDDIGNLVVLTDEAGKPIERYDYDAYGERTITVDLEPPAVTQIRLQGTGLLVELSEAPWAEGLIEGAGSGLVTLTPIATGQPLPITVDSDNLDGLAAGQRMRLDIEPSAQPAAGDSLELRIEPEALRDPFGNQPEEAVVIGLTWPASETVLHDSAAPEVRQIVVRDRRLSVEFSEPVEPAIAGAHLLVDGGQLAWQVDQTGYQLQATAPLPDGGHELRIEGSLPDLSGQTLGQTTTHSFSVSNAEESFFVQRYQDPREVAASTTGNAFGFHGRPEDEETGFLYFRNRYLDPEMGRFLSADPLGYVDGPSVYAFAMNNPINLGDPMGLEVLGDPEFLVEIRSYAPFETFGQTAPPFTGFKGDNRGPTTASDVNSKMRLVLLARPRSQSVEQSRLEASTSKLAKPDSLRARLWSVLVGGKEKQEQPIAVILPREAGDGAVGLVALTRSANPLVPLSPDIDLNVGIRLEITQEDQLRVSGGMFGDGFPNAEIIIRDSRGASYLAHTFETEGGAPAGPFRLIGAGLSGMGTFDLSVSLTEDGEFECEDDACVQPEQ